MTFGNFGQNLPDFKLDFLLFGTKQTTKKPWLLQHMVSFKKVDKVPSKEIERAVRLKDNYFNNKLKK